MKEKRKHSGSRLAMILAAEQLIAENGASLTSLRQIMAAAGVRNRSAVQYHFGSREELIEAVYVYRAERIGARRELFVEELRRADRLTDQRSLLEALIRPLAAELEESGGRSFYCRFLASRLSGSPQSPPPHMLARWTVFEDLLRATLAYLPDRVIDRRMIMVRNLVMAALAELEGHYSSDAPTAQLLDDYRFAVELLIDAAAALLIGPVSNNVLDGLRKTGTAG